jgi:CheY-like chemotaxis protein
VHDGTLQALTAATLRLKLLTQSANAGTRHNLEGLSELLSAAHGYEILQINSGIVALRLARQHKPDPILMDTHLPEVCGLEATKWLREDDSIKAIPVIALAALAMKGDEGKSHRSGNL